MDDKAIFLDRDDTIVDDPGYISKPEQVKLLDGAAEALVALREMGYKLVLVSNQSGIARGYFTETDLAKVNHQLEDLLAEKGAQLDSMYYCPYLADAEVEAYRRDSDWRKPNPGMLFQAARDLNIDLSKSWMVGDSMRDVKAGRLAGCKTILVSGPKGPAHTSPDDQSADFTVDNISDIVRIISSNDNA